MHEATAVLSSLMGRAVPLGCGIWESPNLAATHLAACLMRSTPSGPSDENKRDPPMTALTFGIYACFFVEGHAICKTGPRSFPGDLGVAPAVAHVLRRCVADTLAHLAAPFF